MAERTQEVIAAELAEIDGAITSKEVGDDVVVQSDPAEVEAEGEAGKRGWVPKALYKGDPAKWKPASQYLEDGRRYNNNLQKEIADLRGELSSLKKTGEAFAKYHEQVVAQKDSDLAAAISELRVKKSEATGNGEHALAVQLEDRIELLKEERQGLKEEAKEAKAASKSRAIREDGTPTDDPVLVEWMDDGNEWFRNDPKLRAFAVEMGSELVRNGETLRGRKFLDKVAGLMAEEFPRQFAKKAPVTRQTQVEANDQGGQGGGQYSVHDLPAEDLALMKDFIAKGWTTKERFLKNYFEPGKKSHRTVS